MPCDVSGRESCSSRVCVDDNWVGAQRLRLTGSRWTSRIGPIHHLMYKRSIWLKIIIDFGLSKLKFSWPACLQTETVSIQCIMLQLQGRPLFASVTTLTCLGFLLIGLYVLKALLMVA